MSFSDPYQIYVEGAMYSRSPLGLVVALYQAALEAVQRAESCLIAGDIAGRTKAINHSFRVISHLLSTLDLQAGGEIAQNLQRLYSYMLTELLDAQVRQSLEPLTQCQKLLSGLLEGWREAANTDIGETRASFSETADYSGEESGSVAAFF